MNTLAEKRAATANAKSEAVRDFYLQREMAHKVTRVCGRCHAHRYHWIREWLSKARMVIECAECGHKWNGRYHADRD
jgi:DNA-directed RNA polymerase subunit M/transcription elongation factor TFIIS